MGARLSSSKGVAISTPDIDSLDFTDEIPGLDISIIDQSLIDILSFVPGKNLIKNCRLVCKDWKNIIDGHGIWKLKCERERKYIPHVSLKTLPSDYYKKIYFYNPYCRNLIQNPCGEEDLEKWTLVRNGGDGFHVENPPCGADPVPPEVGSQSCFATACMPCVKFQIINLLAMGVSEEILQLETTKIQVGEWFCARFDCASEYKLFVALLDENYRESDEDCFPENLQIDHFEHFFSEVQWAGRMWHSTTHTFENVGKARYVFFLHSGKDSQLWAGNYGSKMTGAFVKIIV
ncbi:hypothetical protein TNIN_82651 [Trichonephila inaurata madagascariensis]|uniref:FBA domain-containing protein n=1 Tax=Trichonephila inaurata madagascariensis TaxID=2747483 RepID=A0A8X7BXU6_9ARAC|nr:hypothetical protein TNIN_82651 [Trichonephila inaurata madagascariensis]